MATFVGRLVAGAGLAALLAAPVPVQVSHAAPSGAVYVVTRTDDPTPGDGCLPGDCSLREAVLASNANPGVDTIRLSLYTIYSLSIPHSGINDASTGDLNLTDSVNFDTTDLCVPFTNCASIIRGGAGWNDRVFSLENSAAVDMPAMSIEYGHHPTDGGGILINSGSVLTLTNGTIMSNTADMNGGGIYNLGSLTLDGSLVTQNQAQLGGGGIYSAPGALVTEIDNSTISYNQAQLSGGGLLSYVDTTINNSNLNSNTAVTDSGGGFYFGGGGLVQAAIIDSTIVGNSTGPFVDVNHRGVGGGIFDDDGLMSLTGASLVLNSADCGGGIGTWGAAGIQIRNNDIVFNSATTNGGGICAADVFATAQIAVANSTLSSNSAKGSGGGLYATDASLYNVTLSQNTADSNHDGSGDGGGLYVFGTGIANIENSILAGNIDTGGQPPECAGSGELHSLGYNLIQGASSCTLTGVTTGNKPGQDPLLGALLNNGGQTFTQALPAGSPAVNAGNPAGCRDGAGALITADQRGNPRWSRCDMGAYEFQFPVLFLPLARR